VALVSLFWKRPHITKWFWRGALRLQQLCAARGAEMFFVAVCSPGDRHEQQNAALAHSSGARVALADNDLLPHKHNVALALAKTLDTDYVLFVNSDNFLSDTLMTNYLRLMREGIPYCGLRDLWFYDPPLRQSVYWPGYSQGHTSYGRPCGCARLISRATLTTCGWQLWPDSAHASRALDAMADATLSAHGIEHVAFSMSEVGDAVDIKSDTSISSFQNIALAPGSTFVRPGPDILEEIPEWRGIAQEWREKVGGSQGA